MFCLFILFFSLQLHLNIISSILKQTNQFQKN